MGLLVPEAGARYRIYLMYCLQQGCNLHGCGFMGRLWYNLGGGGGGGGANNEGPFERPERLA